MQYSNEKLFPKPQKIFLSSDRFTMPSSFTFSINDPHFKSVENSVIHLGFLPASPSENATIQIRRLDFSKNEAYRIQINCNKVVLSASEPIGVFRGLQTLKQVTGNPEYKDPIPCMEIEDFPIIERRGFMLDVSRCKVPTMESVYSLIDLLAELRINEFQLYIEHTFAFRDHHKVWEHASPFTPNEIRKIDRYCQDRFIELIPNLNSFGHFERWLRHQEYRHMAECPDGFHRQDPFMIREHGTTLKPNQASLDFIDSLYSEYLPNFTSNKFNVGMDEPWELGQGWSKGEVEKKGKDKVYLNHLEGIRKCVESHGKEMQFWADVLLEKPENARLLPSSASPIIWGYEPDHPFSSQAEAISSSGLKYSLAPGTGNWRSFSGRWPNTRANIDSAISNAEKYQAQGVLLTSWGDCGNHQPWPTLYPPLFYASGRLWNKEEINDAQLTKRMDEKLFTGRKEKISAILLELGKLDQVLGSNIPNSSLTWSILFDPQPEKVEKLLKEKHTHTQLIDGLSLLSSISDSFKPTSTHPNIQLFKDEISIGLALSTIALQKGVQILKGQKWEPLHKKDPIFANYQKVWLARARTGGLQESMDLLLNATTQA